MRVFLIVLDSFGIGAMPDSDKFGDIDVNTFYSCYKTGLLDIPNMKRLGLFNIDGVGFGEREENPVGAYGRLSEKSAGKDTTVGHWEIAGLVTDKPFPTYPEGFPHNIIDEFSEKCGRGVLCNKPYSGTQVLKDFGEEHIKTGDLIVYTSADSVFQIAAHEDIVPIEKLYSYCEIARDILTGEHGVARVIARPFVGVHPAFQRTSNRHDFSMAPTGETMLDRITNAGKTVYGIGKIYDIFSGKGISEFVRTSDNTDGMNKTIEALSKEFSGLCFVNLVDFDMTYGHRRDCVGYTEALNRFDKQLGEFMDKMHSDDVLIITADHGCDPGYERSTDHTREYVPYLEYKKGIEPENLDTKVGFDNIAKRIEELLGI